MTPGEREVIEGLVQRLVEALGPERIHLIEAYWRRRQPEIVRKAARFGD